MLTKLILFELVCCLRKNFMFIGDANKLIVHELGATSKIFALTSHEERVIQRNATMAFGLMSSHRNLNFILQK